MLNYLNYKNNTQFENALPDGMINGQGMGTVKNFRYGLFSFGWCGCEIIASYNLLKMYGKPMKLCDISKEIYAYGHILCGFFGTNVYVLHHFFKKHSLPCVCIKDKKTFFASVPKAKYGTVSFWTGKVMLSSIHTVAFRVKENGKITVYNKYNNRDYDYNYDNIEQAFGEYPFIVANVIF